MDSYNLLLPCENRIICEKLLFFVEKWDDRTLVIEERLVEFDDCKYCLSRSADGRVLLSFALPEVEQHYQAQMINQAALETLATGFPGVATLVPEPMQGYQITLDVDVKTLGRLSQKQRDYWIKNIASIRLAVIGTPLRQHFVRLCADTSQPAPVEAHCNRRGQVYFVQPSKDSVTVIFPMRFVSAQDAAIGTTFLQEFVEARRTAALGLSPACNYFAPSAPPLELRGVSPELIGNANGGYMCFKFFKRHVAGPQLEHVLWSCCTFYFLITYHIKCCKAMMHTRMRSRVDAMLQELQGGVLAAPVVAPVEKVKRTATGRYFTPDCSPAPPPAQMSQPRMRDTGRLQALASTSS